VEDAGEVLVEGHGGEFNGKQTEAHRDTFARCIPTSAWYKGGWEGKVPSRRGSESRKKNSGPYRS
jgi:hypothetical protein